MRQNFSLEHEKYEASSVDAKGLPQLLRRFRYLQTKPDEMKKRGERGQGKE